MILSGWEVGRTLVRITVKVCLPISGKARLSDVALQSFVSYISFIIQIGGGGRF